MADGSAVSRELSPRRIIGFACNQAFIFFLVYLRVDDMLFAGGITIARADVLSTLLFMIVGFAVVRLMGRDRLRSLFARPLLYAYAVVAAAASLLHVYVPDGSLLVLAVEGFFVGLPCSFLLAAWGRSFGDAPSANAVPEVFLGYLVAAFLCWVFSLFSASDFVLLATRILPLASVVNIVFVYEDESKTRGQSPAPAVIDAQSGPARVLSLKILAGTFLFGVAAGLIELASSNADAAVEFYRVCMVLFGAFLIGALSLLLSDGFGRGAALNKAYRLAVFVMLAGALATSSPLLVGQSLSGQSIVFAGYLGLEVVLFSLYLVMAEITASDSALSLSAGLLALFAGEFVGVSVSSALTAAAFEFGAQDQLVAVIAGVVVLVGYIFLFTERDFDTLSEIVSAGDTFESICENITDRYGLSNRESEILAFALRGRTSERIAQELVISKNTVDTHLRRIYAKCGIHSRQELLDLAEAERLRLS